MMKGENMRRLTSIVACVATAVLLCSTAQAQKPPTAADWHRAHGNDSAKLHPMLRVLADGSGRAARVQDNLQRRFPQFARGEVTVNVVSNGDAAALAGQLRALGLSQPKVYGSMVSGRISIAGLKALAAIPGVQTVRPALARTNAAGLVVSQGDRSMRSDRARARYKVDGRGVTVGILSDSFSCLTGPLAPGQLFTTAAQDIANGDLPANVKVLSEASPCEGSNDEGRAIAQIIHDVAPGASILYHTAFNGEADFAQGIIDLADAGANVIIDDVGYFDEPMFQDGIVAQAVDTVKKRGVAYFSSSGNDARASYESEFRLSRSVGLSGVRHNFGTRAKPDPLQTITLTPGTLEAVFLNWDEPFKSAGGKGSRSDVDLIYYDMNGDLIPICDDNLLPEVCQFPGATPNVGGDAFEEGDIVNTSDHDVQVQVSIELYEGPAPHYLKYVWFDFGDGTLIPDEYDTQSGASYGHPIARGAMSVGAAAWYNTAAWNSALHPGKCFPACLEYFSSAGGVPTFFDKMGNRQRTEVRRKPQVVGPDGGNSTFFFSVFEFEVPGSTEPDIYPNFFGTSASAPHVAAVAALMIDKQRRSGKRPLSPDRIYQVLQETAKDMRLAAGRTIEPFPFPFGTRGFDFDSGYGFVDAVAALDEVGD
jgi:subtilisin family serine protease